MEQKLKQHACPHCGSQSLEENQQANVYCLDCGRVQENLALTGGATFVNQKMDGQVIDVNEKYNRRATEKRLARAKAKMVELRDLLKIQLDDDDALIPGMRIMRYADSLGFFEKGKNVQTYAAAAFYIALRSKTAPYLLIDFSDKMNMNLFKLARSFLKLFKFLDFQSQLPIIDPSLYIHRYCKALDLGAKTKAVTLTAIKLIQRMKRDWMCQGRRPSSLCGAAILIATKIHDVKCSTSDICKTVYVCDETIRRRLEEFKKTSVAKLTKEQFERMDDNHEEGDEMDPPAFQKARQKSLELEYKKEIQAKLAAIPHRDKLEKIPWQTFRDNLNIPEELLAKQVRGVERQLQQARERYEQDSGEQSEVRSYITDQIYEQSESQHEEEELDVSNQQKEIDSQEIEKFILNEQQRKLKKNIWIQHNSAWLQKEKARSKDTQKVQKKRTKKKQGDKAGANAFEAIKNTKLGEKVNIESLKTLLGSSPHEPSKPQRLKLGSMFDPFAFSDITQGKTPQTYSLFDDNTDIKYYEFTNYKIVHHQLEANHYGNPYPTKDVVTNFFEGLASNITSSININITLDSTPHEKATTIRRNGKVITLPVYTGNDEIKGRIDVQIKNTNRYEHLGLKCFLIGYLEIYEDPNLSTQFTSLSKELEPVGYFTTNKSYKFKFSNFDKDYQSFKGIAGRVRYFIRVVLNRNVIGALTEQEQFAVFRHEPQPLENKPTILEVGVDERLHIQFKLHKNKYHIKEWVEGTVTFHKVKMPVQKMTLSIVRRQTLGGPDSTTVNAKILQIFEVMDGCPEQGDVIPFRMCMRGVKGLAPSYQSIHNRLFVRHWFDLTIHDSDNKKYWKQAEVIFYRK